MTHEMGERHQQIIVSLLCGGVLSHQNVIILKSGLHIQLSEQSKHGYLLHALINTSCSMSQTDICSSCMNASK